MKFKTKIQYNVVSSELSYIAVYNILKIYKSYDIFWRINNITRI